MLNITRDDCKLVYDRETIMLWKAHGPQGFLGDGGTKN